MCTEQIWKDIKETEEENWVDEAGMRIRLFNIYPFVLSNFELLTIQKDLKMKQMERRMTPPLNVLPQC